MRDIALMDFATKVHFKRITPEQLREGGSFNIVDGSGLLIGIFAVPISDFKKSQIQSVCTQMNMAVGK